MNHPSIHQPISPKLTRGQKKTLFGTAIGLPKNFSSYGGGQTITFTYIGACLQILKKNQQNFPQNRRAEMIKKIESIQERFSSTEKSVVRWDLMILICGPGFRQFWIDNFSFDQFFAYLHNVVKLDSDSKRLYIQYKSLALYHYIETFYFVKGRLFYHPIVKDQKNLNKPQLRKIANKINNPRMKFLLFEELRSKEKQIQFCQCFLDRLNTYNIKAESVESGNDLPDLPKYKREIEEFIDENKRENPQNESGRMNEDTVEHLAVGQMNQDGADKDLEKQETKPEPHNFRADKDLDKQETKPEPHNFRADKDLDKQETKPEPHNLEQPFEIQLELEEIDGEMKMEIEKGWQKKMVSELVYEYVDINASRSLDSGNIFDLLLTLGMKVENQEAAFLGESLQSNSSSETHLSETGNRPFSGQRKRRDSSEMDIQEEGKTSQIFADIFSIYTQAMNKFCS